MAYSQAQISGSVPPFVSWLTNVGYGYEFRTFGASLPASATWGLTNRIYYAPVVIPVACVAYRLFWANGSTVGTNDLQAGIYNDNDDGTDGPGTAVVLGTSTLSAGASVCQFDNIADTPIYPGKYWLALWCNGNTATVLRSTSSSVTGRQLNTYVETNASGLPTTATPAQATSPYLPLTGFTTIASP
jgi:hypothetical protein